MHPPNRRHDRESFFKYMCASTAKIALSNRTLRWSSPVLFNDPFDVPRELSFGLSSRDIVSALKIRMADLIKNPPGDTTELELGVRFIVDTVKRGIPDQVMTELLEGMNDAADSTQPSGQSMEALRAMWRATIPNFRILSLTESPAHLAMWCHYADLYRGVVLEFRCLDELDSPWFEARPVDYPKEKPGVYTASGWAKLLTLKPEVALRKILHLATFTKSADWAYENEWRITSLKREDDTGPFTDYKFHAQELGNVYLGPMMISPEDSSEISSLLQPYPNARTLRTEIGMDRELHVI